MTHIWGEMAIVTVGTIRRGEEGLRVMQRRRVRTVEYVWRGDWE